MQAVHCIIPARIGSSRFPGKPLFKLCGREMILRTMDRAKKADCFASIVCATDDDSIADLVKQAGYEAFKTGPAATGSDRVAFAAKQLGLDLVVNLQGDEPVVDLDLLRNVSKTLAQYPEAWVSACSPLNSEDASLETVVKVLVSNEGFALDFRRNIPAIEVPKWQEHRGIYAYSLKCREEFSSLPQSSREVAESLEQLRILGKTPIRMIKTLTPSFSVDVLSDAEKVEALIRSSSEYDEF